MFRQMLLEKEENSGIAPVFDEAGRPVYVDILNEFLNIIWHAD